ncbi:MAG: glucuronate isomerase [Oscillospiraceae bacterium]|nr:glucuronate isomerase [Oscillospiraceae bacterium]
MKAFMDRDFLLQSDTAKTLYHSYAGDMPVIDYHCHVSPAEIAQNRGFENLAQIWLGGDHYKWRIVRASGEDERLITGDSTDYEKFLAFARALPKAVGNPVYQWTHLELRRYFDCDLIISPATADEIWKHCNDRLKGGGFNVRDIIRRSRVEAIATTDDPTDTLEWHKAIAEDSAFETKVVPAFRPDKAVNIEKPEFKEYIEKLGRSAGVAIRTLDDLYAALVNRLDFFDKMGCRASDHGLDYVPFAQDAQEDAPKLFARAMGGGSLTASETDAYKTALLLFFGREYAKRGWVMQLHYGAQRNVNSAMFARLGPDTGYDAISARDCSRNIARLLDALESKDELPKTVLYSLNPNDDVMLVSICGCFMRGGTLCKVQHGSAWWFNDTKAGMENQLAALASRGLLSGFIGMLTDSRSFLCYTRHEYFRRILCNVIGAWVENGEYPADMETLGGIVRDISYNNTKNYFGF